MLAGLPALLEAEALPVHLQDVHPVCKAVNSSNGRFEVTRVEPRS